MEKISITLDVSKIDKSKITERRYHDKNNKEVIVREIKLDIVPVREAKMIKDGGNWEMWKMYFVAIPQTTEERANKVKSVILGDGIVFKTKKVEEQSQDIEYPDGISVEDIPY